jgi:MFS family permease
MASIYGRRASLLGVLFLFAAGSVVCGAAKSMNVLIVGRSIQGAGGGAAIALSQVVIADLTSLAERYVSCPPMPCFTQVLGWSCRGTFLGLSAFTYVLAGVFGPLIGTCSQPSPHPCRTLTLCIQVLASLRDRHGGICSIVSRRSSS